MPRSRVAVCLLAPLLLASTALAQQPTPAAPAEGQLVKTVIVGLKARRGVDEGLAQALSDIVQSVFATDTGRVVLGRQDIAAVLGLESEKQAAGCDDASCLSEVANALDADRIITGSMDRLGTSYLLVISELDARKLLPLGRVDRQLSVPEEELVGAVREAAHALLGQTGVSAAAPLDEGGALQAQAESSATEVASHESALFWNSVSGVTKIASGGLCVALGFPSAALGAFGMSVPNANGVITEDDVTYGSCFLISGSACCLLGIGLASWGVLDFLSPPLPPDGEEEAAALGSAGARAPLVAGADPPMAH